MAFTLEFAVIHSFEKEKYTKEIDNSKIVKQPLFNVTKATVIKLVQDIHVLLGKEKNKVYWGQFSQNNRQGNFPKEVLNYIKKPTSEIFETLSHTTIDELVSQAKEELLATGSHTLIASYASDGKSFLLVANVKEKDGLRFGQNYEPIESSNIDMTQILQAARININRYREVELEKIKNTDTDTSGEFDKTYLCFISKGKNPEASKYFIQALGCEKGIASSRATKNAIDSVYRYFKENENLNPYKKPAKENVIRYLKSKLESKEPNSDKKASIEGIVHAAQTAIPPERAELISEIDNLSSHLNNEKNQVPDEFTVSQTEINKRIKIKGHTASWDIEFETSALGETANSAVFYDRSQKTITLSLIPEELERKIEQQLATENN